MNEPVVYVKPGCPFGIRLRTALTLHRVPHRSVRFRDDEDGAAQVRLVNDGNEISPTVRVADRWLTNPGWREVRDATSTASGQPPSPPWAGLAGWALIGAVLALVGYVVVAVTLGAGFEDDLARAAEREGVAINAVASSTQAQITQDHALYAFITSVFLLLPPVFLIRAAGKIRTGAGGRLAHLAWWSAVAALLVWWGYVALGLGLFADPENLPPLVRDFGPLTVPLVSALSLLALGALVFGCEAVRGAGVTRRSARVASVISVVLGAISVAALVASGFEDPVAPIVIVPGALVLGIALVRSGRSPAVTADAPGGGGEDVVPGTGTRQGSVARTTPLRWRPVAVAVATTSVLVVGCGSDDPAPASATPDGRASTSATSAAPAAPVTPAGSALEGSWQTGPVTLEETEATVRRHGFGRYVTDYRANAPFVDDTVLTLTVEDGAWDLYGRSGRGRPEPIDYDAEYEVDGDTVVFHHSDGSNTYRWQVDGDTLTLRFVRSTMPSYRGIPDEVFQRALYMTAAFTRQG